jgi:hypothetical protein
MEKKRKSRWGKRSHPKPIQINKNYLDILAIAGRYAVVRTKRFVELLPHRSEDRILRQLSALHDHGYLERTDRDYRHAFAQLEHYITEKGRALLNANAIFPGAIVRQEKGEQRYHTHTLMIGDLMASIEAGAGERLIPRDAITKVPLKLPYHVKHKGEEKKGHLRPDELFGIKNGEVVSYYLVECENTSPVTRDTLAMSSFLRKALAYYNVLVEQKLHKEQLGIRKVRVLVTAPTLERLRHKMQVIHDLFGVTDAFLFQVVPFDGKLPNLFTLPWHMVGGMYSLDEGRVVS